MFTTDDNKNDTTIHLQSLLPATGYLLEWNSHLDQGRDTGPTFRQAKPSEVLASQVFDAARDRDYQSSSKREYRQQMGTQ